MVPRDCDDWYQSGERATGVYLINPAYDLYTVNVSCWMGDGGGWTIIQERLVPNYDIFFNGTWNQFKYPFGKPRVAFWLGNEIIHKMTSYERQQLRTSGVSRDKPSEWRVCKHDWFYIDNDTNKYKLTYSEGVMLAGHNSECAFSGKKDENPMLDMYFSTFDNDNDQNEEMNCAEKYQSGWWHNSCFATNFNGPFRGMADASDDLGMFWRNWTIQPNSLIITNMLIRRKL